MREFIDHQHKIIDKYLDVADGAEPDETKMIAKLQKFIKEDPEFYDPYTWLANYYLKKGNIVKSRKLITEAYTRARLRILDDMGRWPDVLSDGPLENKHIIRAFVNQALLHWSDKEGGLALDLLRNLVRTDHNVSNTICCYIVAIRLGWTFDEFEKRFGCEHGYDPSINEWFDQEHVKFPEEWWDTTYEED